MINKSIFHGNTNIHQPEGQTVEVGNSEPFFKVGMGPDRKQFFQSLSIVVNQN